MNRRGIAHTLVFTLLAGLASMQPTYAETFGAGSITAQFLNPTPPCPPAACSGIGTNGVFWGTPEPGNAPNNLAFTGRGFATRLGEPFVLGLLQFQNSSSTNNIDRVDIRLQSSAVHGDPTFIQSTTLNLSIVQTPNQGIDPAADADYVYFTSFPQFGSFRVHEGEVSTVELLGAFNSLDVLGFGQSFNMGFTGFGQVGSPSVAFVNSSISPTTTVTSTIPEPSALALLATGLVLLVMSRAAGSLANVRVR